MAIDNIRANSSSSTNGRYSQGGTTDVFATRLGWWERIVFPTADDDITYTVESGEATRADLIAYKFYSKANLAWLVLQFNNIVDPSVELVAGTRIKLPTPSRVALTITTASL